MKGWVNVKEAGRRLNITPSVVRRLVDAELLVAERATANALMISEDSIYREYLRRFESNQKLTACEKVPCRPYKLPAQPVAKPVP